MNEDTLVASEEKNPIAPDQAERSGLLEINPETFRANFNRRPFAIRHRLAGHPLLTLQELVALAKRLPAKNIKYQQADLPVLHGVYDGPQTGLSAEETIRQIEECKSWMVLRWVENDPVYRELLNQCLDEIQCFSEAVDPGMALKVGFIFVSSPGAVTPYHLDPEHNFLLQISGSKTVHISDPSILAPQELEEYLAADGNIPLSYKDEYETKSSVFGLSPGDGVHVPLNSPHWVKNGDEVSISFSITFRTQASERWTIVNDVNVRLRRFGMRPTPFGRSSLLDSAKYQTYRALRRAKRLVTGTAPQP